MNAQTFYVSGMHCKACPMLVESELLDVPGITAAKASLKTQQVEIEGPLAGEVPEALMQQANPVLEKHGYLLTLEKPRHIPAWREFAVAVPIAALFLGIFIALQKLGLVNLVDARNMTYGTAFVIGLIASISTCMAVVGGLTLSVSANFAKEGDKVTPQVLFHVGRLVAFFLLGGVIGSLGAEFQMGGTGTLLVNLAIGLIMLVLGINLLDVFPFMKKLQPTLPRFLSSHLMQIEKLNHTLTPALLGAVTFFLPCGFTQSMQFITLSSGGFLNGGLTMLVFALGTLPVLGALSFASLSIHSRKASGIFFKASGLIVIAFALFNLMNVFVVAGIIQPVVRL